MNMKLLPWLAPVFATLAQVVAGGCNPPAPATVVRPSFPYPDGGPRVADGREGVDTLTPDGAAQVDATTSDGAAQVDAPASDTQPAPDRASPDVPPRNQACPTSCDDNNPCTVDTCDNGACFNDFAPDSTLCENTCLVGGQGQCSFGVCKGAPAPDGTACEDKDPCTLGDTCKNGLCFSGPTMPCYALDICHEVGNCDRALGACTNPLAKDGKGCDDGLACTTGDQCEKGTCAGTLLSCPSCEIATGICQSDGRPSFPSGTLAVKLPSTNLSAVSAIAADASGALFVVGSLVGATDLGSGLLIPAGSQGDAAAKTPLADVLVAKISPATGNAEWSKSFGDYQPQQGGSIAVNQYGQIAITGVFNGSLTFGDQTVTNPSATVAEVFVAGLDSSGAGLWAIRPQMNASPLAIAADPTTGDFVVCGSASDHPAIGLSPPVDGGTAVFDTPVDDGDIVVARLDRITGKPIWGRQISAPGTQTCDSVVADSSSRVFLAGGMSSLSGDSDGGSPADGVDFGAGFQLALPQTRATIVIWVAKLDGATGSALAASSLGAASEGQQETHQITLDNETPQNLWLAGGLTGTGYVGSRTLNSAGARDALLVKFDAELHPVWGDRWGSVGGEFATAVAAEPSGTLVVAGSYADGPPAGLVMGGISLPPTNLPGAFLARIDQSGKLLLARGYGGPNAGQSPFGVVTITAGSDVGMIWLAGVFTGKLQLGRPADLLSTDAVDTAFLARIEP